MVSEKIWFIINVSLGLLTVLLALTLAGLQLPTLGQAQYYFDKEEPLCGVDWKGEITPMQDLDRCCLQAREQLECHRETDNDFDWLCQGGTGSAVVKYRLNNKAYNYCGQQPYW